MRSPQFKFVAGAAAILLFAFVVFSAPGSQAQEPEGNFGVGIPDVFLPKYLAFREAQLASPNPDLMRVDLGYVKGLSTSFVAMNGEARIDLQSGTFSVSLNGLTPLTTYTVAIVDGVEPADLLLGLTDTVVGLTTFLAMGPTAVLNGLLPTLTMPPGTTIDRIVVSEGLLGGILGSDPLAAGSVNVFQKIFHQRLSIENESTGQILFEETTTPPEFASLVPDLSSVTDPLAYLGPRQRGPLAAKPGLRLAAFFPTGSAVPPYASRKRSASPGLRNAAAMRLTNMQSGSNNRVRLDRLISQGARLFFQETFSGNGRTCGTCHPANNNFMIDPEFIATLPANNPLFVAEFNPALAQLEKPALMRQFGLILENLDGLENPTVKFVMRGVPHTLGMQVSLERDPTQTPTPAEMTGWSGDGAPGTGSLRDFATGAVTQHFTKRLNRVKGTDFRLPTDKELDAMEAFQLSLGREKDFVLVNVTFTDPNVQAGRDLFINGSGPPNGGTCIACHRDAGAIAANSTNRNFNTNVEDVVHPARNVQNFPKDGGFGRTPLGNNMFGNRAFNTAPVVEAADTPPFFHNNVVTTLDGIVQFYSGPEFNNPRAPAARFNFDQVQRGKLVKFMRGINTLQNIDVAKRELQEILANTSDPISEQNTRLQTAFEEVQDSIDVLSDSPAIFPTAKTRLIEARNLISQAQASGSGSERRTLAQQAITKLGQARTAVATT